MGVLSKAPSRAVQSAGECSEYYNEEEDEKEFTIYKDITFLTSKIQQTHMVDKGTTIKLSCIVDKYPENLVFMWQKLSSNSDPKIIAMDDIITSTDERFKARTSIEKNAEGD